VVAGRVHELGLEESPAALLGRQVLALNLPASCEGITAPEEQLDGRVTTGGSNRRGSPSHRSNRCRLTSCGTIYLQGDQGDVVTLRHFAGEITALKSGP
jgi:hypothetical protein